MSYKFGRIPKQERKTIGKITPTLLHLRQLLLDKNNLALRKREREREKEKVRILSWRQLEIFQGSKPN